MFFKNLSKRPASEDLAEIGINIDEALMLSTAMGIREQGDQIPAGTPMGGDDVFVDDEPVDPMKAGEPDTKDARCPQGFTVGKDGTCVRAGMTGDAPPATKGMPQGQTATDKAADPNSAKLEHARRRLLAIGEDGDEEESCPEGMEMNKDTGECEPKEGEMGESAERDCGCSDSTSTIDRIMEDIQDLVEKVTGVVAEPSRQERLTRIYDNAFAISAHLAGRVDENAKGGAELKGFFESIAFDAAKIRDKLAEGTLSEATAESDVKELIADLVEAVGAIADELDEEIKTALKQMVA